jgi:hypothetical protein
MQTLRIVIVLYLISICLLWACEEKKESAAFYESENQFSKLVQDLNAKFSERAYYKTIMLTYDNIMGNTLLVKVLPNADSAKLQEWFYMNNKWEKKSDFETDSTLSQPTDKLFSINNEFDLLKLVDMVDLAKDKVKTEKNIKDVNCKTVSILMQNIEASSRKMDNLIIQLTIESNDRKTSYELGFDFEGKFEGFLNQ